MAGTKEFIFAPQDLMALLTHYSDGAVPLDGEVTDFLVHQHLQRKIGLLVQSDEWDTEKPLFINYDGKRIACWTQDGTQDHPVFEEMNESPVRQ